MGELNFDAIIVAGGKGSRLGGVSKPDLLVGGERLLDRVLSACEGAAHTVMVGTAPVPSGVIVTLEDPPGTGPAAGLVAGLDAVPDPAEWTLVLACDLPDAASAVGSLFEAARRDPSTTAWCARNVDDRPEWLLGLYRTDVLRAAVTAYGDPRNRSVRRMLSPLSPSLVDIGDIFIADIDTWADHAAWNARNRKRQTMKNTEDRSRWRPFIDKACEALGVDSAMVDEEAILDMAREIAHAGARPMAPVGAFILGVAVGRGGDADYLRRALEDAANAAPLPQEG